MMWTVWPATIRRSTIWEPINPAPPVTSTFILFPLVWMCLLSIAGLDTLDIICMALDKED
jgi:hypothetical protein